MSGALKASLRREMTLAYQQKAELAQPLVFFILVITLFPLAMGPGPQLLQKLAPGIVWIAALLSSLLGMDRLFRDDFEDGWLEQQMLSPLPVWGLVLVKVGCHWLVTIAPLLMISPILALLLNLSEAMYLALVLTLLLGTPILSLIGACGVALTLGLRRGGVLLSLLLLPLFVPLLIFATSAVDAAAMHMNYTGQLAIMGALMLLTLALSPLATAYGLRVSQN